MTTTPNRFATSSKPSTPTNLLGTIWNSVRSCGEYALAGHPFQPQSERSHLGYGGSQELQDCSVELLVSNERRHAIGQRVQVRGPRQNLTCPTRRRCPPIPFWDPPRTAFPQWARAQFRVQGVVEAP